VKGLQIWKVSKENYGEFKYGKQDNFLEVLSPQVNVMMEILIKHNA
jgi:hypothetical protein